MLHFAHSLGQFLTAVLFLNYIDSSWYLVTVVPGSVVAIPLRTRETFDQQTNSTWGQGPGFHLLFW